MSESTNKLWLVLVLFLNALLIVVALAMYKQGYDAGIKETQPCQQTK